MNNYNNHLFLLIALATFAILYAHHHDGAGGGKVKRARVYMYKAVAHPCSEPLQPMGVIDFVQIGDGEVTINGTLRGLSPGKHGFHIHEFGDLSNSCAATGPHFHPMPHPYHHEEKEESSSQNAEEEGKEAHSHHEDHSACLGNVVANSSGIASIHIKGKKLALNGPNSIVGRGLVVHEDGDKMMMGMDMGMGAEGGGGGHRMSQMEGSMPMPMPMGGDSASNKPVGCGVVAIQVEAACKGGEEHNHHPHPHHHHEEEEEEKVDEE